VVVVHVLAERDEQVRDGAFGGVEVDAPFAVEEGESG
jgi:hypothetical protein